MNIISVIKYNMYVNWVFNIKKIIQTHNIKLHLL